VKSHLKAWEQDYCSRGRLWGGAVKGLPDLPAGTQVLELGCGSGKAISAMKDRSWKVVGLDISLQALRLSRSHSDDNSPLVLADGSCLPFHDQIFDAVFAFHVIGHVLLADREKMAREAERVLKPGGKLFFREFGRQDMRAGTGDEIEPWTFKRGPGMITHYFTEEEAAGLFYPLRSNSILTKRWKMRIRGQDFDRCEVEAVFFKC
jgi:ubiquinone/menaquinone biosynthesis C-methylase UbiE